MSKRLVAASAATFFVALAIAGLAGWAVLLVLALMVVLGLVVLAAEIARPHFIKDRLPHDEEEVRDVREAQAEHRRSRDFGDCSDFG